MILLQAKRFIILEKKCHNLFFADRKRWLRTALGSSLHHESKVPPSVPSGGSGDILQPPPAPKTPQDFMDTTEKHWVSYGFDKLDYVTDRKFMRLTFAVIFVAGIISSIYFAYFPDYNLRKWAYREAFLELERREKLGLPLIDPNYVPPENIPLPAEEELEGVEIYV